MLTETQIARIRELVEIRHSYHEDDNRYPRDFWHVRACFGDLDTGWVSYGEQEAFEQDPVEKAAAEVRAFERITENVSWMFDQLKEEPK